MSWITKESCSISGWGKRLLSYKILRLDLGPTQPPCGAFFPGAKNLGLEASVLSQVEE
jgi:hypothetical protein